MAEEQQQVPGGVSLVSTEALQGAVLDHVKDHPNLGVDVSVNGIKKNSVWIDPPTTLTYSNLSLGAHPAFQVFVAIHPYIYDDVNADGAEFRVDVRTGGQTKRLASIYINPSADRGRRKWTPMKVDLALYAGKTVDLILSNSPGPAGNDYADWCIWGDPRLTNGP